LLDVAISCRHIHIIEDLLAAGFLASVQACSRALVFAMRTDDLAIVEQVWTAICAIEHAHSKPSSDSQFIDTCNDIFKSVCLHGRIGAVRWFIASIPDLSLEDGLLEAWSHGRLDIVRELISAGTTHHTEPHTWFLQQVVSKSRSFSAHKAHGGNRQPLIELLIAEGAWWDTAQLDYWECVSGAAPTQLLNHFIETVGDDLDVHRVEAAMKGVCREGNMAAAQLFLDVADERGYSLEENKLFDIALRKGYREIAEMLFRRLGSDEVTYRADKYELDPEEDDDDEDPLEDDDDWDRYTPLSPSLVLMYAAACSSRCIVSEMLGKQDVDVNKVYVHFRMFCKPSFTALSRAFDPRVIELLLDAKADVNPRGCVSVLQDACEKLYVDSVKMLLEAGAEPNAQIDGISPLFYAMYPSLSPELCDDDQLAIINLLFDAGARAVDPASDTSVLHKGLSRRTWQQMDISSVLGTVLARDPAALHCRDGSGATALMLTLQHSKRPRTVQALLDAGADPCARDHRNTPALFYLFWYKIAPEGVNIASVREVLRLMLSAGADPIVCNNDGETLIMQGLLSPVRSRHRRDVVLNCSDAASSALICDVLEAIANHAVSIGKQEV
jgi:hypothetical protein